MYVVFSLFIGFCKQQWSVLIGIIILVRLKQRRRSWASLLPRRLRHVRRRQRLQLMRPHKCRKQVLWRHFRVAQSAGTRRPSDSCCHRRCRRQANRKRKLRGEVCWRCITAMCRTTSSGGGGGGGGGGVVVGRRRWLVMRCVWILWERCSGSSSIDQVGVERRISGESVWPRQSHALSLVFHATILKPNLSQK